MKLSCLVSVALGSTVAPPGEKRYSQFREIFLHYYENAELMKVYGYGCYCLNLGDRPLSGIMTGVYPVDEKDMHCFEFTKCNRCVTFDHGPDCTPEQVNYNFDIVNDEVVCTDPAGTCPNAICQCDKDMITGFKEFLDVYNPSYSAFQGGFDSMTQCELKPKDPAKPKAKMNCCGEYPNRRPFNSNEFSCCDGEVTHDNQCVDSSFN